MRRPAKASAVARAEVDGGGRRLAAIWAVLAATAALIALGAAPAGAACPNEEIRQRQGTSASALPECRAYEMVSPVAKNGVAVKVTDDQGRGIVAANGGLLAYTADGAFPGSLGSFYYTNYLASRGADNWSTVGTTVPITANEFNYSNILATSEDASRSLAISTRALAPGAIAGNFNFYRQDNATGRLDLIETFTERPDLVQGNEFGGSADFDHVLFIERRALTPNAIDNGEGKLYEYSDGKLRLASILPDGKAAPGEVFLRMVPRPNLGHMVADNGSRVFFHSGSECVATGCEGLFMREGDQTTAISISQRQGDDDTPKQAVFLDATPDGSVVYFASRQPLTDESWDGEIESDTLGSLYRFDVDSGKLEDVSAANYPSIDAAPQVRGILGTLASPDGSTVYFEARGRLTPDAPEGQENLYVWHKGELRLIASSPAIRMGLGGGGGPQLFISHNGQHAVFRANGTFNRAGVPLDGDETCPRDGWMREEGPCWRTYYYDLAKDETTCVSCPSQPGIAPGHSVLGLPQASPVSDRGQVFFQTTAALLPGDTNSQRDVYEWYEGRLSLISSGKASTPTMFMDASPDGEDVYFSTYEQLVPADNDELADAYTARVGGGLPAQMAEAGDMRCAGDECPAPVASAPPPSVTSTGSFRGPGNRRMARCPKAHKKRAAKRKARRQKHGRKQAQRRNQARKLQKGKAGKCVRRGK